VERELTSKGEDRRSMGREAFLEYAWKYKEDKAGAIVDQIRRLGASADWSKQKFTLDSDVRYICIIKKKKKQVYIYILTER
jgi:valyl-tRNA synthetase